MANSNVKRRKDSKGRVLEKGESQRADGTYMFRWTDRNKKRQTVYAKTLNELREIELQITKTEQIKQTSWDKGKMTVQELISLYRSLHTATKITTQQKYKYFDSILDKLQLGNIPIRDIHISDAKSYMLTLRNLGYSYATIQNFKGTLSPIFQMAVEDDFIVKNPFVFRLEYIIDDDRKERTCLTPEVEKKYLDFIKNHSWYKKSYDDILILLQTGMRVSELYGLTFKDLDFQNNRIYVNKQLHYIDGTYYIMSPKSKAGTRMLAMTPEVKEVLKRKLMEPRPNVTHLIDGHSGFVFINKHGNPKYRKNLQMTMLNIRRDYKKETGSDEFDKITPHVFRHTFCSRMIEKGIEPKTLQVLMGHSDIGTTLDTYTHMDPEKTAKTMEKLLLQNASNA